MSYVSPKWNNGSAPPLSAENMQALTDAVQEQGETLATMCNPNLLDNWYFGNPVNQRGQTEYPASNGITYTIDRWIQNYSGVKINDGYTTIGGPAGIFERIENIDMLVGKLLTFSTLTTDGFYTGTITFTKTDAIFFDTDNLLVLYNSYFTGFQIAPKEGSAKNIIAAKLELGSQQTLVHQENGVWVLNEIPKFGDQLAACQRYAVELVQNIQGYTAVGLGVARTDEIVKAKINVTRTLRAIPSVSVDASKILLINGDNFIVPTGISVENYSAALVDMTIKGAFVKGTTYEIFIVPGSKMFISADL